MFLVGGFWGNAIICSVLFVNLPVILEKKHGRMKCQKSLTLFCCPVFWGLLLFFSCWCCSGWLHSLLLCAFCGWTGFLWLCFAHLTLVKSNYVLCFFVCLFIVYAFWSVWNAGTGRKKRRSLQGWLFAKRSESRLENYFWFCFYLK